MAGQTRISLWSLRLTEGGCVPSDTSDNDHPVRAQGQPGGDGRWGAVNRPVMMSGYQSITSSVCFPGDGQVSLGPTVVKGNAKKVRRLPSNILVGFAGSTADAMTLLERLEKKLEEHPGQLMRACVELAKLWRSDKYLRRLEVSTVEYNSTLTMLPETDGVVCCLHKATLLVADATNSFELTGNGDVLEPEGGVVAIGSGGSYALGKLQYDMQCTVV